MSFDKLLEVDCISYHILVRDALIYSLRQTKEGQEKLHQAWILTQTEPDIKSLREQFT